MFGVREGDFFRTRLTHSLEVAQIAKGLALRLGADTDLVEAAALVHDVGHPPFGHAGEAELQSLMMDYGGFEANAQNLRVLSLLEHKSTAYSGLNLTRATLDAQLKYKHPFQSNHRKFYYHSSQDLVSWVNTAATPKQDAQSLECQIMDWADDIAYAVHDLEDSIHGGFITPLTFYDKRVHAQAIEQVHYETRDDGGHISKLELEHAWNDLVNFIRREDFGFGGLIPVTTFAERQQQRKMLTSALISRYIKAASRSDRPGVIEDKLSPRYKYQLSIEISTRSEVKLLIRIIWNVVIQSAQIATLEEKGRHIVRGLFTKFTEGSNLERLLPEDWQELVVPNMSVGERARLACDFVGSMTDNYAQQTYARLFLPHQGSVFDLL